MNLTEMVFIFEDCLKFQKIEPNFILSNKTKVLKLVTTPAHQAPVENEDPASKRQVLKHH